MEEELRKNTVDLKETQQHVTSLKMLNTFLNTRTAKERKKTRRENESSKYTLLRPLY